MAVVPPYGSICRSVTLPSCIATGKDRDRPVCSEAVGLSPNPNDMKYIPRYITAANVPISYQLVCRAERKKRNPRGRERSSRRESKRRGREVKRYVPAVRAREKN